MRTLLVETDPHAGDAAALALGDAGHEVLRCHEGGQAPFPCIGLSDPAHCPLDNRGGVDVVVDLRAHPYPTPTPLEDGVACALRRDIPLVVAGTAASNPYARWQPSVAEDDDVVEAVESVHAVRARRLGELVARTAAAAIAGQPGGDGGAFATVRRLPEGVSVSLRLPGGATAIRGAVAERVRAAVRAAEPNLRTIDVGVSCRGS